MNSDKRLDINPLLEYRDLEYVRTDYRPVCVYDPRKNQKPIETHIPLPYQGSNANNNSCRSTQIIHNDSE